MFFPNAAGVAAGDVTDNTQSVGDVMMSLLVWRHAERVADTQAHRQTSSECLILAVHYIHMAKINHALRWKQLSTSCWQLCARVSKQYNFVPAMEQNALRLAK